MCIGGAGVNNPGQILTTGESLQKIAALVTMVTVVALWVIGGIMASGRWGGGSMYFIAGGLILASLPVLAIGNWVITRTENRAQH